MRTHSKLQLFITAALAALVALSPTAALADTGSAPVVVSMGDSYSSGEGNPHFYGYAPNNTGTALALSRFESEDWLAHRSLNAWPSMLKVRGQKLGDLHYDPITNTGSWFFIAASGAMTYHILGDGEQCPLHGVRDGCQPKSWGFKGASGTSYLPCQMDIFGKVNAPVDYVTLTMGGNDLGFERIVRTNVISLSDLACTLLSFFSDPFMSGVINMTGLRASSTAYTLSKAREKFDDTTRQRLHDTYDTILHAAGSQATLIVAGYPRLYTEDSHVLKPSLAANITSLMISPNEASMVNRLVDYCDNVLANDISSMPNVRYAEVRHFKDVYGITRGFNGHGAYGANSYINEISLAQAEDLTDGLAPSSYSMHPNRIGQAEYAAAVQVLIDDEEQKKNNASTNAGPVVPNTDVNISVVMDVSGSMDNPSAAGTNTKLQSAQQQSEAFVLNAVKNSGQADNGGLSTRVGISAFSETSQVMCDLSNNPDEISSAINSLSSGNATNIYAGLSEGIAQLENREGAKIMMFLSDGLSNRGPGESEILGLAEQAKNKGIVIYTIGFGPSLDLDESLLQAIADTTGGSYAHEDSSSVASASVGLFAAMMDAQLQQTAQLLHSSTGTVAQGATTQAGSFSVNSAGNITAYLYWPGSALDLQLIDPSGVEVKEGYAGYSVDSTSIPTTVTIQNAMQGTWNMNVYGRETSMAEEPFYAAASFVATQQQPQAQAVATRGGGGGALDSGPILLLILAVIGIGSILGLYALTTRK